jgi:hypothetical protein
VPDQLRITTHGFDEADLRIKRVGLLLSDLRSFWPLVVPIFIGWMRSQFASEGTFSGERWSPLSTPYATWKSIHYPGKPILQATGALRRAASMPTRRATPRSLTLTIHDPKISYHQEGTDKMPARPLIFSTLPPIARRELQLVAERYVREVISRA